MSNLSTSPASSETCVADARLEAASAPSRTAAGRGPSARYIACAAILFLSAVTMQSLAAMLGNYFRKLPVELRKPLALLNMSRLGPQYRRHPFILRPLTKETLNAVGCQDYLQCLLVSNAADPSAPGSTVRVFITYFTGQPDMVPHVPDECLIAGGYETTGVRTVQVPVPKKVSADGKLSVRIVSAVPSAQHGQRTDLQAAYFFICNNKYATTRNEVRVLQGNLFERFSYYAKIEMLFTNYNRTALADLDQTVEALGPLLGKLMPVLLEDHFADWEALTAEGGAADG